MLFTVIMSKKAIYLTIGFILFFSLVVSCSVEENDDFSERVKISLREVGNQLLLSNKDSTSLILPVVALEQSKYRLSFQNNLTFEPNTLVSIVQHNLKKSKLPEYYRVEVIQCADNEVAYSYEMSVDEESTLIPCLSRVLPEDCYTIEIRFINRSASSALREAFVYIFGFITITFVLFGIYRSKKTRLKTQNEDYIAIGRFKFFKAENKLVKEAEEISLSKKESELLAILVSSPNVVVTRDELTKRVWEDNGVIVGRSLDTFISKLRKKLSADQSIIIENVHGVGYKLVLVS
ncbi:winged helix-turn-helix domain-containing protein [Winogradskyella jejuensis]|uniref:Transcriptional regulatory protein, C terminal n=1 Tax=Winogradskyella jejuensis TaxID=1089305 RepID=A0A1M5M9K8_9FLAO|nr:winged helix-turn-helix domain-containing protein [Winogradskyella jejuensis]SHG73921.1 Transcriptional regulatory protein, C terminal [Winogradskyella jejuensis]